MLIFQSSPCRPTARPWGATWATAPPWKTAGGRNWSQSAPAGTTTPASPPLYRKVQWPVREGDRQTHHDIFLFQPTAGWLSWRRVVRVIVAAPVSTTGGRTTVTGSLTRTPTPAPPAAPHPAVTRPRDSTVCPGYFSVSSFHLINLLTAGGHFHFSQLEFNWQDLYLYFDKK